MLVALLFGKRFLRDALRGRDGCSGRVALHPVRPARHVRANLHHHRLERVEVGSLEMAPHDAVAPPRLGHVRPFVVVPSIQVAVETVLVPPRSVTPGGADSGVSVVVAVHGGEGHPLVVAKGIPGGALVAGHVQRVVVFLGVHVEVRVLSVVPRVVPVAQVDAQTVRLPAATKTRDLRNSSGGRILHSWFGYVKQTHTCVARMDVPVHEAVKFRSCFAEFQYFSGH